MSRFSNVGNSVKSFNTAPKFDAYTKVVVVVSDKLEYVAGTDGGRTMTVENPWGTQDIANNILVGLKHFQYQPFTASDALVDPALELGDVIEAGGVRSRMYSQDISFGPLMMSNIAAPHDEELDHEYPYVPKQDRKVHRQIDQVRATLTIQNDLIEAEVTARKADVSELRSSLKVQEGLIAAKVSQVGGDSKSFGWELTEASWTLKANESTVLTANKEGLSIKGKVEANSGLIGGLTINSESMYSNGMTWLDSPETPTSGVYIGPNGIKLGKNFQVDALGNLKANSGTFTGSVQAGNIVYGDTAGYMSGAALAGNSVYGGKLAYNTVTTAYTSGGINTSLGYADFSHDVFSGVDTAQYISCYTVSCMSQLNTPAIVFGGRTLTLSSASVADADGNSKTLNYVGWVY